MRLFSSASHRNQWRQYLRRKKSSSYKKGELILMQDQTPAHLKIIKSGVVRVYDITSDGEERTISFDVKNEVFPIGWAFQEIDRAQYFYEALTDVETYNFKREEFLRYLKFHPKMAGEFYANTAVRFVTL